jgi:hypothetical protein
MEQPMPNEPRPADADNPLRRFREYVASGIALLIVVSGLGMVLYVLLRMTGEKEQFERGKDVLLFINPIIGLVIGYYFNKASTEARAESAEKSAHEAHNTSVQAVNEREHAQAAAQTATVAATKARKALKDLADAASQMVGERSEDATLGISGARRSDATSALQQALQRAREIEPEIN